MESLRNNETEPTTLRNGLPRDAVTQEVFDKVLSIYYGCAYPGYDMPDRSEPVELMFQSRELRLGMSGNWNAKLQLINNENCRLFGFDFYGNTGTHDKSARENVEAARIRESFQTAVDEYLTSTGLSEFFEPY